MNEFSEAKWFKSGRSGSQGACVEVADLGAQVGVRDSKNPQAAVLTFPRAAFADFVDDIRAGRLPWDN